MCKVELSSSTLQRTFWGLLYSRNSSWLRETEELGEGPQEVDSQYLDESIRHDITSSQDKSSLFHGWASSLFDVEISSCKLNTGKQQPKSFLHSTEKANCVAFTDNTWVAGAVLTPQASQSHIHDSWDHHLGSHSIVPTLSSTPPLQYPCGLPARRKWDSFLEGLIRDYNQNKQNPHKSTLTALKSFLLVKPLVISYVCFTSFLASKNFLPLINHKYLM